MKDMARCGTTSFSPEAVEMLEKFGDQCEEERPTIEKFNESAWGKMVYA
jgi:hypothetical protein